MIKKAITTPPVTIMEEALGISSEKDSVDAKKSRFLEELVASLANFVFATVDPRHMMMESGSSSRKRKSESSFDATRLETL
jgi:hypothetical protein